MGSHNDHAMDQRLLSSPPKSRSGGGELTWKVFVDEVKRLGYIAGPMVAINLSQYLLQVISLMMVGHLGELQLSSTAIAVSLASVTGFSVIAQSLIVPMLVTAVTTLCFHVPVCWALVFKTSLENVGAALAMCLSNWLSFATLALYVKYSPSCAKTMVPISTDLFHGIGDFFRYAIPSAVMICLEWWSFELLVLLSGLLPNPALETSVLSVCLTTIATFYSIPYGLGAAASTRVSNELGRGKPELARISVFSVMSIGVAEALLVSITLYACRHAFGYSFSNDKEVIDYVTRMAPLICLSVIMDSLQGVLSGIARGCGWQHIGAYINLGAFYLCGIPVGVMLGFWTDLRGKGLWIGVQVGAFTQTLLLFIVTICTNWEKQASDARQRISKGGSTVTNALI
ncbi:Protein DETOXIFICATION 12 [Linum grandiflorum]